MKAIKISYARVGNAKPMYAVDSQYVCPSIDSVVQVVWGRFGYHVPKGRIEKTCGYARKIGAAFLDVSERGATNANP
jgi:hypothetical protein